MPSPSVACINPGNPCLPTDARVGDPVVPWSKGLAVDAIGQAAGTLVCEPARAIIHRMRFAED
ncbi:MAG: hypothetical protein ACREO7_11815 [Pseudoxanthomonas sp.]